MEDITAINLALVISRKNSALWLGLTEPAAARAAVSYWCAYNNSHANGRLASWQVIYKVSCGYT